MSKRGKLCTALGLLLLLAALGLTAYNLWRDAMASMSVDVVLERLTPTLSSRHSELPALSSGEALEEAFVPDHVLNPEMAMPEETIDGRNYIGVLDIPALDLSFPIISEWSYDALQIPAGIPAPRILTIWSSPGTITAAILHPFPSSSRAIASRSRTWTATCFPMRSRPLRRFLPTLFPI